LIELLHRIKHDLVRFAVATVLATIILFASTPLATLLEQPAIAVTGMWTAMSIYGVGLVPLLRRLLFPYLDLKWVYNLAARTPEGPGRVFLGVCIVIAALLMTMGSAKANTLPAGAVKHIPVLVKEVNDHWPTAPDRALFAGQVEQETCPSLKHSKCWSPTAELRTDREQGHGLGQVTRTHRFDALAEMRAQYPAQLQGWGWDSPTLNDPSYQLRALVLMDRRNYERITGAYPGDRMVMALVSYNGGLGGLSSDRRVCAATKGCDPSRWWGHVEHTSLKAKTAAKGYGLSFFQITRNYPVLIAKRAEKYRSVL
jgi:hypothetical protein